MELDIRTVTGGPLDVNTYVVGVEGARECLIIDPGAEYATVEGAACGREVKAVLLTHAHFDHMLYARPWLEKGSKLYVHQDDAAALSDPEKNLSGVIGTRLTLPKADVIVQDGDKVCEAGVELFVLHTPGHTPGSVCYRSGKTLFCGDTLFYKGYGRVDLAGGDSKMMMASLARLMMLEDDVVCYPGHGIRTKIGWERGTKA